MRRSRQALGRIASVLLGVAVAGCGGGSDGNRTEAAASAPLIVDGRFAPQADADVHRVKQRDAATAPAPSRIALGPLDLAKALMQQTGFGPQQVAVARAVPAAASEELTLQQLRWQSAPSGGHLAALSIAAQEAHGLRLGVRVAALPDAAVLRVYSQDRAQVVLELTGADVLAIVQRNIAHDGDSEDARTWWTPDTGTAEATLEIELPAGVPVESVQIAVPTVSHVFVELEREMAAEGVAKINESDSCNRDALCDAALAAERNAVARMVFVKGGNSYLCTGTLLNDKQSSGTPYFLSANHCISTQASASSLETYWFYQSAGCQSRLLSSNARSLKLGATLLHASTSSDVSFMRLNSAPPAGAYFAGWEANPSAMAAETDVTGLHHPAGDMLMISKGRVQGQTSCRAVSETGFTCSGTTGNFDAVRWTSGTTQGGSSGSALFNGNGRVVGTLYGGSTSCSSTAGTDYYGRFYVSYQAIQGWLGTGSEPEPKPTASLLDDILSIIRR